MTWVKAWLKHIVKKNFKIDWDCNLNVGGKVVERTGLFFCTNKMPIMQLVFCQARW